MQATYSILILMFLGLVFSQQDLISDPGLYSLSGNQCSTQNLWHFRSDYVWNDTSEYVNARCAAFFEIPTPFISGISKGDQTNINHAVIPDLPTVTGALNGWTESAGVVDMNSACRASLWAPFTLEQDNPVSVVISLKLWVRSNDQIEQFLLPTGSQVPGADLLQYLPTPDGLLGADFDTFPPLVEETNQVRIDVIKPDENGKFYDRAFSLIPSQIELTVPISNWDSGNVVPATGTDGKWIQVTQDVTGQLKFAGDYALRVASAQSQIGVSWGITDVHIQARFVKKRDVGLVEVEEASEELLGSLAHVVPPRKGSL